MQIVDNYTFLPGCCWICRGVSKPIIDMQQDLDGHNSPDDPNPSATTRLYICADCGIEIGRMVCEARSLQFTRFGELALANQVANEQAERADIAETRLAAIANAVRDVQSNVAEQVVSVKPNDGDDSAPGFARLESDIPLVRKRGRPRHEETLTINTDFVGDL